MAQDFISDSEYDALSKAGKVQDVQKAPASPDFISDEDFAKLPASAISDPTSNQPMTDEGPSPLQAGMSGAMQGITFNMLPRIAGASTALMQTLSGGAHSLSDIGDIYNAEKTKTENELKGLEEAQPLAYKTGELAGGVGTALIPGLGEAQIAKTLGTAAPIAKAAIRGGIEGGLYGAGGTQDLTNIPEAAKNIGTGAVIGTALAGAGAKIFEPKANSMKLLGATPSEQKILARSNVNIADNLGNTETKKVADYLPEWLSNKIPLWKTKKGIETALEDTKDAAGKEIGDVLDQYNALTEMKHPGSLNTTWEQLFGQSKKFDFNGLADQLENDYVRKYLTTPGYEGNLKNVQKFIEDLRALHGSGAESSLNELNQIRQNWDKAINWKVAPEVDKQLTNQAMRDARVAIYDHVTNDLLGGIDSLAKMTNKNPINLRQRLIQANTDYTMASHLENVLEGELARGSKNKLLGLTDWLGAGAGIAGHLSPASIAQILGAKRALEYAGPRIGVATQGRPILQRITQSGFGAKAPLISTINTSLANASEPTESTRKPDDVSMRMDAIKQDPKYGQIFQRAGDDTHLQAVYHNLLMGSDEEYRKKFMEGTNNE